MFGPTVVQQVWHPVTLRLPEWDAKQFGNIKSLYLSAFDGRTSPPFGQTGVAFFIYRFNFRLSHGAIGSGSVHDTCSLTPFLLWLKAA